MALSSKKLVKILLYPLQIGLVIYGLILMIAPQN